MQVAAYIVECQVPGVDFTLGAPQLSNGIILGEPISIEIIETERQGRLAACSQPLFTKTRGIRDWWGTLCHVSFPLSLLAKSISCSKFLFLQGKLPFSHGSREISYACACWTAYRCSFSTWIKREADQGDRGFERAQPGQRRKWTHGKVWAL